VQQFVAWYHNVHRHRAPKFVTPVQRPRGEDVDLLVQREVL
jgi:putative transposase